MEHLEDEKVTPTPPVQEPITQEVTTEPTEIPVQEEVTPIKVEEITEEVTPPAITPPPVVTPEIPVQEEIAPPIDETPLEFKKRRLREIRELDTSFGERKRLREELQEELRKPVVEEPKPPVWPVETEQDIKAKETSNKAAEDALNEQNKITKTEEFTKMVQSGATLEELSTFGAENPTIRKDLAIILRDNFKNSANVKFFGKHSTMTNEQLQAEVNAGNIVPWSERFNLLPEEQRNSFKQFQNLKESVDINDKTDFSTWEKIQSLNDLFQEMQNLFSTDLRSTYKDLLNSPEILKLNSELADKRAEIEKFDIEMEDQSQIITRELAWNLPWVINAAVRDANRDSVKEKRLLLAEYNATLWEYQSLKDNAKLELDFIKYEDQQNRQTYMTNLSLYENRRSEMREDEKTKFQEESRRNAEERQLENQKTMLEFKNKLDNQKINWQWKVLEDGLYFLKEDGTTEKVLGWEKVNWVQTKDLDVSEIKNEDGTITISITDKETWDNSIYTKDIFGNIQYPSGTALNGTDLRSLQNKYPWQAWAKNNNSSWITFQAASDKLKGEWAEAGISFSKWSARPSAEGGNYVWFPTIQDWLAAHAITLWRKRSSIQEGLASWVWTPKRDTNLQYARDLYEESGITKPITTPLNQLSDVELYSLMKAQIKRESPWLYSEMRQKKWFWDGGFNIPIKVEETKTSTAQTTDLLNIILPSKATEFSRKSLTFGTRMADSTSNILNLEKKFSERDTVWQKFQTWAPNFLKDKDQQLFETFKENFVTASLRLESGAAIWKDEFDREERKFFPMPWDSLETIQAKQKQREITIQLMLWQVGRDENDVPVWSYYTPNNIDDLWSSKDGSVVNSKVDSFLKTKGLVKTKSDPAIDSIFGTALDTRIRNP